MVEAGEHEGGSMQVCNLKREFLTRTPLCGRTTWKILRTGKAGRGTCKQEEMGNDEQKGRNMGRSRTSWQGGGLLDCEVLTWRRVWRLRDVSDSPSYTSSSAATWTSRYRSSTSASTSTAHPEIGWSTEDSD